ncbi:MAG: hypothetical protein UW43_C0001G0013 [Candidatus Yanofskybacteria bacterium GW2011_GWA1_44_21]|uniref:DUF5671 domain-containing protein n=2 Tax=Candidatus Yanofskyibacteriota TaxID=1752733 RepID=A0A1F8H1H4_9BACT|nr:MAG: hypothetical protein UW14_C0006G0006 [Candidatus Yanofskybacteria bacterium GW2011_GWA2_44_10]KKT50848.1 MAG: hypothetical protein UW43_C0001G0013 [Candidatus Yanofskybacteria bacterium GW2011_GWA1_44_21]KKT90421.1 MAG: hypothetical protein UW90_C0001G0009 [Candidatus Yanofskybacteria bacterium GW2011_GWB1_45_11]OGN02592.1 MAG: hypothetical protein A2657_00415 [Candidatus Yanofskybacteria bacterium RIFCSPHIGHO2_01_FULL_44_110b]OGN14224.1 MAG: hypothetical protein A3C01_01345 [Candidatus
MKINTPRDTFLYLLSIATLAASAVSFGIVVFQLINNYYPDMLNYHYYSRENVLEPLRGAMAALIIIFPVFWWVARFLRKDIEGNPEKRDLGIRRWLLYLTLFVAGLVIIGDLVAVLNGLLHGELTIRFIFKALTVLFIAGSVFYYYISQLKEKPLAGVKVYSWIVVGAVAASIVGGFIVIGSPMTQRAKAFDQRRINDLQVIQNEIVSYWQSKRVLPGDLSDLTNSIPGFRAPIDPETGTSYEYLPTAKSTSASPSFQLCATFKYPSDPQVTGMDSYPKTVVYPYPSDNWTHDAGRQCFLREIDPDLYPSRLK